MMMIFNELRKHGRLAAKRHPMYEKNKYGKIIMYIGAIFWAGYLVMIGSMLAISFSKGFSNREPYQIMNAVILIFVLIADFLLRFPFQATPTQEVKPYLLVPVKRNRLIDFLLIRSGLSTFNLLWLFMFLPFAIITIPKYFGVWGVITYCIGIWLLMVFNNYWYLLCRTLLRERIWWVFLPIAFYAGIACCLFIPEKSLLYDFFLYVGDGYIEGNILCFLGTIALIALLWLINRKIMSGLIYNEINKVEDTKVKHVSEYKFFEKFGEVGEYMRLELKMLFRNKRCKGSLRMILIIVIMFSGLLSFTEVYDNNTMTPFITYYAFMAFGMLILIQIMGFEGNYIDGLMSRKESILSLLRAKYYTYCAVEILPFILMIPAMVMGKITILGAISWAILTAGPVYYILFQMAVYNKKTVPLNEGMTGRQSTNSVIQIVINLSVFAVPLISYRLLNWACGELATHIIFTVVGLGFILTSPMWIRNIYLRFMKRRYENMEGFRDSR